MPFHRVIIVHTQAIGTRDEHGEYVDGPVTDHRIWVEQTVTGSSDILTDAGSTIVAQRQWAARYVRAIATHRADLITATDEYGNGWTVDNIQEDGRRRYMQIEASGTLGTT